jgi:hypothetical protein
MADQNKAPADQPDRTPNFELPLHGVISEDNWPEYEAKGFKPISTILGTVRTLDYAQSHYGVEHVYTGDAYDDDAQRPLRHKPGTGIYVDPDGLELGKENSAKHQKWLDGLRQDEPDGGPGAN